MAHQPKSFTWTQTSCTVKTKSSYQCLRQTVTPNVGPVYLKIDTEREFQHTNDLGWNWHKSWNIPNISIKLVLKNEECAQWMNCQVQLMAVKLLQPDLFEEVGLEGTTLYELEEGRAFFNGVKFNSTTYNHQGHKFQLLLVIKEGENIILTLQSPPIFIDSRKSARDEHRQIQYIQPFEPKYLERNFCKKEKHQNDVIDAPIENNENGLHNYLTAPNIRNKIKHPIFLALKFSRCFSIYYSGNSEIENHLIEFQKQLMFKCQISQYLIVFQSNNNRIKRKIEDSLNQLYGQTKIKIVEKKLLNEHIYQKLEFNQEDYRQSYNQLILLMNQFILEQQEKSESDQQNIKQDKQVSIEIEPQSQSQIKQTFNHLEKKSAFKKYKDFDKLPTKNFEDEKLEQYQRLEKLKNIREMENQDKLQKIVKIEENNNQLQQYQLLQQQQLQQQYQQSQFVSNNYVNQINELNSNFQMVFQQKLQEQLLQYYMLQQQLLLLQMPSSL
ncbi:unnamed protein product [Paramecium sonneborni]|uniref:Uncharacterized protein n=1 Tax=Paramecium sonneborni TaxID=65129 RepID=A0A8S1KMQ4_9CILI|nr:unnamed protein product [Paramecium sonneborni]